MTVTSDDVTRFARAVEARLGIRVGDRARTMFDLIARRSASHHETPQAYLERVDAADVDEWRALASEVSVGETYFFRHVEQFHVWADLVPALVATRGHARVLSVGCSTGEEPYTLAMVARERIADPRALTIHGVDLNPVALARARRAHYSRWVMRATPPEVERRWFTAAGREVALAATIRDAVRFSEANLIADGIPDTPPWDVIFCRNVLMYFGEVALRGVVDGIVRALAPGGYLFLGHAETLREHADELELCHTHGTFYYRRRARAGALPASAPAIVEATPARPETRWIGDIAAATERVRALVDGALARPARPGTPAPSHDAIRALITEERFTEARDALALLPPGEARLLRAIVHAQTGDPAAACAICGDLLAAGLDRASAHYLLAICDPDPAAAEQHARDALAADPGFAMACVQLAFLARRRGDRAGSSEHFGRAIGLLERDDDARLALFAGGFRRSTLIELCRSELAAARAQP